MLNLGQNTVLLAKLCRKTKSVLIGAQTILSITVKFHARRMRGAKSVQTIGFFHKLVGAHRAPVRAECLHSWKPRVKRSDAFGITSKDLARRTNS